MCGSTAGQADLDETVVRIKFDSISKQCLRRVSRSLDCGWVNINEHQSALGGNVSHIEANSAGSKPAALEQCRDPKRRPHIR
jgi:hypothetical protein